MLGGTIINVEVLVGLPGSGKTHYAKAKEFEYKHDYPCSRYMKWNKKRQVHTLNLDFDEYRDKYKKGYPGLNRVLGYYEHDDIFLHKPESLIICDGLFLTNEWQEKIVKEWVEMFNEEGGKDVSNKLTITFVYFKENREGCLSNDSYREKERRADITIKHSPFEKPNIDVFKEIYKQENINFNIEEKEVYVMSKYEGMFKSLRDDYWSEKLGKDIMASERWSTGGTWCDYRGNEGNIDPDKAPESFEKFDKILETYCPDITFLKYKNIYNKCVTIEEDDECDYYGGTEYFNVYCCDLNLLYDMLTELGYIKE